MDRRKALRNLGILTSGIVLMPSCDFTQEQVTLSLNKLKIKASEEALMKELVSCIIPEGDLPGAVSLNVHNFVWVMVDDCMDQKSQSKFLNGLTSFDKQIAKVTGKSFKSLDQEEREDVLNGLISDDKDGTEPTPEDVKLFVTTTKQFTSFGYMKSEYIMTEVMPYSLVPGTYGPCETIDNSKRINLNA